MRRRNMRLTRRPRGCARPALLAAALAFLACAPPALAQSGSVRITNLADVPFGTISNLGIDSTRSQNLCVFSSGATPNYRVTAFGDGSGGAFTLSSGIDVLDYEVQWSDSSGQSSGAALSPNVPLTGQISSASHPFCNTGPASSASLILLIRSAAFGSVTAGTYSGTLTIIVGAE